MPTMHSFKCVLEYLSKSEGTQYLFGLPGGASRSFIDELYDFPDIKFIMTKHEQGAGFMADGYARASGKIGFCTSTVAPGAFNLATGLLPAYVDSQPVLAVTSSEPIRVHGKGYIQDSSGWEPRTFGLVEMFRCVTKWSVMTPLAERVPDIITRALRIALTGRKGPVHINIPWDLAKEEVTTDILPPERYRPVSAGADPVETRKAAELLVNADNPAILSGGGVIASNASQELMKLAELLAAPVATTIMGKSSIPEDHPLALGTVGLWGHDAANAVLEKGKTDLLLAIGCVFSSVTTLGYLPNFGGDEIIQIDIDPGEIGKNYPVKLGIVGDAKAALVSIVDHVGKIFSQMESSKFKKLSDKQQERIKEILKLKGELQYYSEPEMSSDQIPIKPQRAAKEIRDFLDKDAIVLADSGNNFVWAERYVKSYLPKTYVVDGYTHMGWSVAAAIGAKLGAPDKQVLDICGDGCFMMNCNEVMTASTYTIPVVWCILDDSGMGVIKQAQKYGWGLWEPERYIASELYNMDFVKFAEACHIYGQRVERPAEIKDALKEAFSSKRPAIIDIVIDPDEMPAGSFVRYKPVVKKYPELAKKKMPRSKFPVRIGTG